MSPNEQSVKSHIYAAIVAVIAITFMTIYAEMNETFKNWLKETFFHHWVGKGVLALILFFIVAHIIKIKTKRETISLINILIVSTIICSLLILGFFVWEAV
ncbi:MAG: hypothetical protein AABX72_01035 [Nanoarchaeota archaeon]